MTRLDQLAKPIRQKGEHIRAIIEREKRALQLDNSTSSSPTSNLREKSPSKSMSKSMTNLHGIKNKNFGVKYLLKKTDASRSMMHLATTNKRDNYTANTIANKEKSKDVLNRQLNTGLIYNTPNRRTLLLYIYYLQI